MLPTIFVQIAAYRDPQLIPTLRDCVVNAKWPENLRFCIAWQYGPEGVQKEVQEAAFPAQIDIIPIPYLDSKGACWARNLIQQAYKGETYTLQLDSHHRFEKHWDETLIEMLKQLQAKGHKKPLLTSYISSFDPENDPEKRIRVPWRMDFDRFIPEGAVFFLPATIPDWQKLTEPVPARFYSAHFAFTLGQFAEEVQHDPNYYFHGEEISIAARAFTHGYDLFHPHKVIAWHEYTRKGRTKHWDDHTGAFKVALPDQKDWGQRNADCHLRNRKLFSMDGERYDSVEWGKYGFGTERTLRDYERYAGIHFGLRAVQQATLDRKYPPNDQSKFATDAEWEASFSKVFKHCIDLQKNIFDKDDIDFVCVAFENSDNKSLNRQDINESDLKRMLSTTETTIKVWREFVTTEKPHHWVVWPHSRSAGWMKKTIVNL